MEDISAYLLALVIGVSLGLIGGGGSILTVPVLVYVSGIAPVVATAYSLFIVGTTSLVGAANYYTKRLMHLRTALVFSVPSFVAVFLVRRYVVPAIPDTVFTLGSFAVSKSLFLMLFFAVIMLLAAINMIRGGKAQAENNDVQNITFNYPLISLEGLVVGALTGLVGAGGGFLIIPALVMFAKLPMRLAVGTSLLIIALKSLIGFLGDVATLPQIDWPFLLVFSGLASGGIFLGSYLGNFIKADQLKKIFGWFVLAMALYILWREL